uniref:Protein phosphatase 1 regulatory subunit 1A n=1 Tax=Castor canadensis TaxID=51338 RepID=A0A8C0XJE6_CASCN
IGALSGLLAQGAVTPSAAGAATKGLRFPARRGGEGREGRVWSQSAAAESPEPGAWSREPGAGSHEPCASGWGRGRSGARGDAPAPAPSPTDFSPAAAREQLLPPAMEQDNSPRKIQFTVPLLEPHLDPEAAEQIRRRRPTPATLVLTSDQSSPGNPTDGSWRKWGVTADGRILVRADGC